MTQVTHDMLFAKLIEHETAIVDLVKSLKHIDEKMNPIVTGVASIAFAFKGLLVLGAGSAAIVGILKLWEHI